MIISKDEFQRARTPGELQEYVSSAYEYIKSHPKLVKLARLKKEPYKTLSEELLPFSVFCDWKYHGRTDVFCSLLPGTGAGDAIMRDLSTGVNHLVEITWPMDGRIAVEEGHQLNERGMTKTMVCKYEDIAPHLDAVERALVVGRKKSLKDYRTKGESTLLLVFDEFPYFWEDNPKHQTMIDLLAQGLSSILFKVDHVAVLLVRSERIIEVKNTERANLRDTDKAPCP